MPYCNDQSFDCNNPIDYTDSPIDINQTTNNVDTSSCGLNSILTSIVEQISALVGENVNIDIDEFISCNTKVWNKKEYEGLNPPTLAMLRACAEAAGLALSEINTLIDRASAIKKIQSWIFNNKTTGRFADNLARAKNRVFNINISCESTTQTYSTTTLTVNPANTNINKDCPKDCTIPIKLDIKADQTNSLDRITLASLPELLCDNGPLICNFTFTNSEFNTFYNNAKGSSDPDDAIFEWTPGTSLKDIDKTCPISHTVVLVGYECFPNNINPTHYIFKFRDSYSYGEPGNLRSGYFSIKIPATNVVGQFSTPLPWNLGDSYGFGGSFRVYGIVVKLQESVEKIKEKIIACCEPTPTPTPTETPSSSPTETPTETPS